MFILVAPEKERPNFEKLSHPRSRQVRGETDGLELPKFSQVPGFVMGFEGVSGFWLRVWGFQGLGLMAYCTYPHIALGNPEAFSMNQVEPQGTPDRADPLSSLYLPGVLLRGPIWGPLGMDPM